MCYEGTPLALGAHWHWAGLTYSNQPGGNHRVSLPKSSTLVFHHFHSCPGTPRSSQVPSPLPIYQVSWAITWSMYVCHTYFFIWGSLLHHYLNHCCVKFHASFDLYFQPGYTVYLPLTLVPWCYCQGNPAQRPLPFPPPPCPFLFNFFLSSFFFFCLLTWFS